MTNFDMCAVGGRERITGASHPSRTHRIDHETINPGADRAVELVMWTRHWREGIVQDVRYALRTLRKSPGFTTIAVLTIALGIGANTAIFSLLNAAILRPLGYPQPQQLMVVTTGPTGTLSSAEYWELADINPFFSGAGAFVAGEANLTAGDRPRRATS